MTVIQRGPATLQQLQGRAVLRKMTLNAKCDGCGEVFLSLAQRDCNGAPATTRRLIDQAVKKHRAAKACEGDIVIGRTVAS